ncbi:MAG: hypothetical protein U1D55_00340 [Phycisphaerae bacterium]
MSARLLNHDEIHSSSLFLCVRTRRLLRTLALTALCVALTTETAFAQYVQIDPRSGLPRRWEAGMAVSPFSTVNLYNGNLTTVIPITGFAPVGPPVHFELYHNSTAAMSGESVQASLGFTFGPGWSCTYAGRLTFTDSQSNPTAITLIEDDGNQYSFTTLVNGEWKGEAGVHERIVQSGSEWVMTRPNGWQRIYDANGYLIRERDSTRNATYKNEVHILRDGNGRVTEVRSAAKTNYPQLIGEHRLFFEFETDGTLKRIYWPAAIGDTTYWWTFTHVSGRLTAIAFPYHTIDTQCLPAGSIQIAYQAGTTNLIETITDTDTKVYTYGYAGDTLSWVDDPGPTNPGPKYRQSFNCGVLVGSNIQTIYTDRRGKNWKFLHSSAGNFSYM